MNEKYFVIAGNRDQHLHFIKKKSEELWHQGQTSVSLSNFIYVAGPHTLRGYRNPTGWLYGSWRDREDIEHVLETLLVCHDNNNITILKELYNIRLNR